MVRSDLRRYDDRLAGIHGRFEGREERDRAQRRLGREVTKLAERQYALHSLARSEAHTHNDGTSYEKCLADQARGKYWERRFGHFAARHNPAHRKRGRAGFAPG